MDIISVFFILSVSVAGTAFMTWVPAYRKGYRNGFRKGNAKGVAGFMQMNAHYGKFAAGGRAVGKSGRYVPGYGYATPKDGE